MEHPDWYPDWRHRAVHDLQEKNERLTSEFRLGTWPRYDYDLDAGILTFSDQGVSKVIAEIQVVGSTSQRAGDWLWAWANSHWPPEMVIDSRLARAFGQEHGVCELTHESLEEEDLNSLGWSLTAVTARLANALGAYRPPRDEGGALFLIYKSMAWVG
jgi:hypothetical protein